METLIIAVVLLTGYIFCNKNPFLKFQLEKTSGLITYLLAGICGIGFCLVSAVFTLLIIIVTKAPACDSFCSLCNYLDYYHFFFIFWALLSLLISNNVGNFFKQSGERNLRAIEKVCHESAFRSKIYEGIVNKKFFQVTLKNNKVYIGQVFNVSPELYNSKMEYFSLCPVMSGYRDNDTHQLEITNSYYDYYSKCKKDTKDDDESVFYNMLNEFTVVIPVNDICSLGFFDPDAYKAINNHIETPSNTFNYL